MALKNILIVEDEVLIAENLKDSLEDLGFSVFDPVISYNEAVVTLSEEKVDLAILDISLSGEKTGIDVAEMINEKYEIPFIFLSSNSDSSTLKQATKQFPSAFLVKPFKLDDVVVAIELAVTKHAKIKNKNVDFCGKDFIFLKEKDKYRRINFKDVLFIKSENVYVDVYFVNGQKSTFRGNLSDFETLFGSSFMRIHRSYIVNIDFVEEFNSESLTILGHTLSVGSTYYTNLLKSLAV